MQTGLQNLLQTHPEQFQGVSAIHAQNVVDQLNLEMNAIKTVGMEPFAAKYINDVQRDLIDIVQGDDALVALATKGNHNGFAAVPDLLVPPAEFQGDQMQTDFMKNFAATSQSLADKAVALADNHGSARMQQLVSDIQTFEKGASEFSLKQGALYSARFDNEFAENGVNGTTSRALIDGLQTGTSTKCTQLPKFWLPMPRTLLATCWVSDRLLWLRWAKAFPPISTRWRRSAPCLTTRRPSSLAASIQEISSPFTMRFAD